MQCRRGQIVFEGRVDDVVTRKDVIEIGGDGRGEFDQRGT